MKKIIKMNELNQCACFNLRIMARELTNDYNNSLKSNDINSTQIPILAILNIFRSHFTYSLDNSAGIFECNITRRFFNTILEVLSGKSEKFNT